MDSTLTKLKRLIAELEDAHQGEGNKLSFEAWLEEMADNDEGTLQDAALDLRDTLSYFEDL